MFISLKLMEKSRVKALNINDKFKQINELQRVINIFKS